MTTVADSLVGRLLDGRYQITERLARGGMATVYRAVDTRLTRTVAVKVMHVGLGDDAEFARKFDREARAAAKLSHPNVVSVFDQGSDLIEGHSSRPYIVMEHVEGYTLRDLINADAPLPPERALQVIEPVLAALAAAHDAGLVHRDVKPENVLISDRGQIKVADFGLAKAISSQTSTATQGLLIGTVSYLPPELVVSGKADARSDIYSAGVVLFELLTGLKPHSGDTPIQVAYAHVHRDVPAPSSFPTASEIPPYLDALVRRATSRNPARRPPDGRALLNDVRRVQAALAEGLDSVELAEEDSSSPEHHDAADYEVTQLVPASSVRSDLDEHPRTGPRTMIDLPPPVSPVSPAVRPAPAATRPPERPAGLRRSQVRKRRRGLVALLLVLLLTAAAAVAGWYLTTGRFTSAPALAGISRAEAEQVANRSGLGIAFAEEYSETVQRGVVISTEPGAGTKILKGGRIDAAVSQGPERHTMPTVVGLSRKAAERAVERANLTVGKVKQRYSDAVRDGLVLAASAKPGASLKRKAAVDLVVSRGPRPIPITSYVNTPTASAKAALTRAGFRVKINKQHSDKIAKDRVIKQNPGSGSGMRGSTVTLTSSLGPVLVTVPNVRAMGVRAAEKVIADAGFKTRIKHASVNYIGIGFVVNTDPPARRKAPKGSTITLYVV